MRQVLAGGGFSASHFWWGLDLNAGYFAIAVIAFQYVLRSRENPWPAGQVGVTQKRTLVRIARQFLSDALPRSSCTGEEGLGREGAGILSPCSGGLLAKL